MSISMYTICLMLTAVTSGFCGEGCRTWITNGSKHCFVRCEWSHLHKWTKYWSSVPTLSKFHPIWIFGLASCWFFNFPNIVLCYLEIHASPWKWMLIIVSRIQTSQKYQTKTVSRHKMIEIEIENYFCSANTIFLLQIFYKSDNLSITLSFL